MRLDINLATQPYEDPRRFLLQWTLTLGAVALLTLGLVYAAVSSCLAWRADSRRIAQMSAQIAQREGERACAEDFLNRPENRAVRDRSQLLNELIARKAFSWTQVFSDLERLMPPRLHVVSIRPELTPENELQLRMVVAGESRQRALDLVRKMESSPRFRQSELIAETEKQGGGAPGDNVEFDISALYVPQSPAAAAGGGR